MRMRGLTTIREAMRDEISEPAAAGAAEKAEPHCGYRTAD